MVSKALYFVDKSYILSELFSRINTRNRFLCVTRPRRFGKSHNACMVASFFGRTYPQKSLFSELAVGTDSSAMAHCGKYEILYIQAHKVPGWATDGQAYLAALENHLTRSLQEAYPDVAVDPLEGIGVLLNRISRMYGVKFVVVIDEWDYIFHREWATEEDLKSYGTFLGSMLKDVRAVALAYLTGVLPMSVVSGASDTNMFAEYTTPDDTFLSRGLGFSGEEVDTLFQRFCACNAKREITRDDLRTWYDGYACFDGTRLYNPQSVCFALIGDKVSEYWRRSGPADEIYTAISGNVDAVRDDIARLVSGLSVPVKLSLKAVHRQVRKNSGETNGYTAPVERNAILTWMVLLGFLSYENGCMRIPSYELMQQFYDMLLTEPSLGHVHRLAQRAQKVLEATPQMDAKTEEDTLRLWFKNGGAPDGP